MDFLFYFGPLLVSPASPSPYPMPQQRTCGNQDLRLVTPVAEPSEDALVKEGL